MVKVFLETRAVLSILSLHLHRGRKPGLHHGAAADGARPRGADPVEPASFCAAAATKPPQRLRASS
jgi:hypothetical protein